MLGPLYALNDVDAVLHFGEFGVVMLLFVIGLELRPVRLWAMRSAIFGLGTAQLVATSVVLAAIGMMLGLGTAQALFIGLALSLSSTAFALQVLEEKGELTTRHGRLAFSVLLFQDLAAIPLIALVPLFALGAAEPTMDIKSAVLAIGTILGVIVVGRFLLSRLYRIVAATGVREAMTASALLTVVGVALVMEAAGLSAALGAFIAGALLADSEYRHQIEADIAPFEGLLLAVFFIAVGMSIDLGVLAVRAGHAACHRASASSPSRRSILYLLGRWWGLDTVAARRLGLVISQGGEFAFVLFGAGAFEGVIDQHLASLLTLAVTLSMAATPLLLLIDDCDRPGAETEAARIRGAAGRRAARHHRRLRALRPDRGARAARPPDSLHRARFQCRAGRFRQALRRADLLRRCRAHRHPARGGRRQGARLRAGDRRCRMLRCGSPRSCAANFPDLPIYARARDRTHVHKLMDLGVEIIERETFLAALELTKDLLRGLGLKQAEVRRLTRPSSGWTRSGYMRTINTTRTWRRSAPMRSLRRRSSRSCSPATSRSCPTRRARRSPLTSEKIEDQPVELGRMGERAHMPRAFEDLDFALGSVAASRSTMARLGAPRLAADDQQRGRGDRGIVLKRGRSRRGEAEFERDFGDRRLDRRFEALGR